MEIHQTPIAIRQHGDHNKVDTSGYESDLEMTPRRPLFIPHPSCSIAGPARSLYPLPPSHSPEGPARAFFPPRLSLSPEGRARSLNPLPPSPSPEGPARAFYPLPPSVSPEGPARSRRRRDRTRFTADDLSTLETEFKADPYPDIHERERLAVLLGVTEDRIQVWFQNRRSKTRRRMTGRIGRGSMSSHVLAPKPPPSRVVSPTTTTNSRPRNSSTSITVMGNMIVQEGWQNVSPTSSTASSTTSSITSPISASNSSPDKENKSPEQSGTSNPTAQHRNNHQHASTNHDQAQGVDAPVFVPRRPWETPSPRRGRPLHPLTAMAAPQQPPSSNPGPQVSFHTTMPPGPLPCFPSGPALHTPARMALVGTGPSLISVPQVMYPPAQPPANTFNTSYPGIGGMFYPPPVLPVYNISAFATNT